MKGPWDVVLMLAIGASSFCLGVCGGMEHQKANPDYCEARLSQCRDEVRFHERLFKVTSRDALKAEGWCE